MKLTRRLSNDPSWGVLGTPAIDLANNLIYVVAWNSDQMFRIYALDLRTGETVKGPVVIEGSVKGSLFAQHNKNWKQLRRQRAGLLLDHGLLYIAFGGDNSRGVAGWLFVYDVAKLAAPDSLEPGAWREERRYLDVGYRSGGGPNGSCLSPNGKR